MPTLNLLYQRQYKINDAISITIPTVEEIINNEEEYYALISTITAMPIDFMVQLDSIGIDFTSISEYDLFLLMFETIKSKDTTLIFGNLDLTKFEIAVNEQNGTMVLIDRENEIVIDRAIHNQIAAVLRKMHHLEKNRRKPANEEAKKYMLKRAKEKQRRNRNRTTDSHLESLIVAMVNTEQYKFDFESTKKLTVYQFNECVRQVIKKVDYNNRMYGVYTGHINAKELSQDDLNWLSHK